MPKDDVIPGSTPQNGGATFDFGLGDISKSFDEQEQLQQTRQAAQQESQVRTNAAATQQARITKSASDVSQQLLTDIAPSVADIDSIHQGEEEQAKLMSSGDPFGLFQAIGNQIIDPRKYTQEGRTRAIAEQNQFIQAKTSVASMKQAALGDLSKVVEADRVAGDGALNLATLKEQQGLERINTEKARLASQAQTFATNTQMADLQLSTMSADQTRVALASSKGQPINVGGVMLSPGQLETRVNALDDRQDIQEQRVLTQQAKKMELDKKLAKKELETMNLEELRPLLQSGSDRYDLSDIQQVYNTKTAAQSDSIARLGQAFQYNDFGARVVKPAMDDADRMTPAIPQNSPLGASLASYKNAIGGVLSITQPYTEKGVPVPIEIASAGDKALKDARDLLDKDIDKEATLKAKGDKDLKDIYVETYRGNPAPRASIESAISTRLDNNKPLDDILPSETATKVRNLFNQKYQAALKSNTFDSGVDKKMLKQIAMQQAIQEGVASTITDRTQDLFKNQLTAPGNPVQGMMTSSEMLGLVAKSDSEGKADFQKAYGLSDDEMNNFLAGGTAGGKVGPDAAVSLNIAQNHSFLMQLDAREAGSAKRYVDWWQGPGGQDYIAKQRQATHDKAVAGGVQEQAMESYAGDMQTEQSQAYVQSLASSLDSYEDKRKERYNHMLSFDLRPDYRQAALLQFDGTLSDGEKQQFMKGFVNPLIQEANKKGLDYDGTNALIESAIDQNAVSDPAMGKLLQKVQKNRSTVVANTESLMTKPFWTQMEKNGPRIGLDRDQWLDRTVKQRSYAWFEDIARGN